MEYHSTLKKDIISYTTSWMNIKDMLSEISQSQKGIYHMSPLFFFTWVHFYEILRVAKFIEAKSKMVVPEVEGGKKREVTIQ